MQNKQRSRKRRRESEDSKQLEQQHKNKRRKVTTNNSCNNKCQSLEPPFYNIRIPVASPRRSKPYHRVTNPKRRRHSTYCAYPTNNGNCNNNRNDKNAKNDHKDQDKKDENENENEDDDLDSSSTLSPGSNLSSSITPNDYPSRLNKLQLRSQPSTPIRNFNVDSNHEPLSQSAKKSQRIRKTRIMSSHLETYKPVTNHQYKQIPNLSSSQSIQFSPPPTLKIYSTEIHETEQIHSEKHQQNQITQKPPLEKSHVIVVGNINQKDDNNQNDDSDEDDNTEESFPSYNLYEIILFIFIGVIVGFIVSFTVYHQNELKHKTELKGIQCQKCIQQTLILNDESNRLKQECLNMQNKIEICEREKDKLRTLSSSLIAGIDDEKQECKAYKSKIDSLEHELGECNVEWGACQQLGRQKDALDKKRVQEIENQKKKFSLCNQQLKRYKKAAKL